MCYNRYFKSKKKEHLENLNKKKALIQQAVSLKDSDDWEVTTTVMKKIQADWKNIGHGRIMAMIFGTI